MSEKKMDLKPCPFCGGEPIQAQDGYVHCSECSAGMGTCIEWNTRPTPQQPSEKKALSEKDIANVSTLFCGRVRKWCAKNNIEYFGDYLIAPVFENVLKEISLPNEKKSKAEAIYEAIKKSDVGDDIVIHNEDMSVWCILNLVTREHPERETNGKDRS